MSSAVRIGFVGDSFVAGVGDPQRRGWVGRLVVPVPPVSAVTGYNLGVRGDTSADVRRRWRTEMAARVPADGIGGVVFSFGVNDTTRWTGRPRVEPGESADNLRALLVDAAADGWRSLVVGPPPIEDELQNAHTERLGREFEAICEESGVPFVPVFTDLGADPVWRAEVAAVDGAHPGAAGYERLAALVQPQWEAWLERFAAEPAAR